MCAIFEKRESERERLGLVGENVREGQTQRSFARLATAPQTLMENSLGS